MSGTPSPREIEGLRTSIMNLAAQLKGLTDKLPDDRWYNLSDHDELSEIRASLHAAVEELERTLGRWG